MSEINVESVIDAFTKTKISANGVSFAGKGLKLNEEADAKEIVDAIAKCTDLQFLNLEGNTLGIEAARSIAKELSSRSEFKRALWKDMFTGRMKDEIPIALRHLGDGLEISGARLTELDLSDNAFGPIGVEGLASLLRSPCCFALQELKLNNNGLGIGGGKLLSSALMDCYNCSKNKGKPLALKIFIAGRNRLENPGATALAEVFKTIGTLEEVAMPQNGIYHEGIAALSAAFKVNKNLETLNLNDNTIGPKGAKALSKTLPTLEHIKIINFGDCLLKTKGAQALAKSVKNCTKLQELILDSNEIKLDGAMELIQAIGDKTELQKLSLNGNCFGSDGIKEITSFLQKIGKYNTLESLDEDESDDDEEGEEDEDHLSESENEEQIEKISEEKRISVDEFLKAPTPERFIALGENRSELLLKKAMENSINYIENYLQILMNVASLSCKSKECFSKPILSCSELLFRELFSWCHQEDKLSLLNNTLLIHLGLIKSEDKKFKPNWDIEGCLLALENIVDKNYFPDSTRNVLKVFVERDVDNKKDYLNAKKKFLTLLA